MRPFRWSIIVSPLLLGSAVFVILLAAPARADNCDLRINPEDCQNTAWTVGTVAATAAAVTGILTAVSGLGGATPAGATRAPAPEIEEGAGEPGAPGVHQQQWNDSCAVVTSQMIIERGTGEKLPENVLRSESHQMPGGYKQNPAKFGTATQGVVDLLHAHGLTAETKNLTLDEMQQSLHDGKQVTVSINVTGGTHRILVTDVSKSPTGRTIITFDDPATGTTRRMTDVGWKNRANPARTIVVGTP